MPRRWRGAITIENRQTGDGRVFAPGAIEWADLPLPLTYMVDGDSLHMDLATSTPQVGLIETITREGDDIIGEGIIDEELGDGAGAEVIARMDAGTAPLGNRFPVSIDPDNWEVEVILTEAGEAEDILIIASGEGPLTHDNVRATVVAAMRAAAGDPDPGDDGGEGGEILFDDSVDEILERYTRLRIRGATLCNIAAFDEAFIELTAEDAATTTPPADEEPAATVAASAPARPPQAWFFEPEPAIGDERLVEQPDGSWACPLTITAEGQVFGHLAGGYGACHTGHRGCVSPPRSAAAYAHFHVGSVETDAGIVATGALVVGCDHARLSATAQQARDHYANSGQGWADARIIDGELAPWVSGALRPGLTDDDLRVLRALSLSGDWRAIGGRLELVSALAVNTPGFPIAREAIMASAMPAPASTPAVHVASGRLSAMVAAGVVHRCADCAARAQLEAATDGMNDGLAMALTSMQSMLEAIDLRTRHLIPEAEAHIAARVHAGR